MMEQTKIQYLQVGQGRLGQLIAEKYCESRESKEKNSASKRVVYSRIDSVKGLEIVNQHAGQLMIEKMVICISPGIAKKWHWSTVFNGLCEQVVRAQVIINELIFISSTRVYDGINKGVVAASDKPNAVSERAKSILLAESKLRGIAANINILRCCGLVGGDYTHFTQLLTKPSKKVRFAIDIDDVAKRVAEILEFTQARDRVAILTDGNCYHNGIQLSLSRALDLQTEHRLLENSEFVTDNKKPS